MDRNRNEGWMLVIGFFMLLALMIGEANRAHEKHGSDFTSGSEAK